MAFELPALPYAYNALEPHIDAKTMEIHHTKHHQAYVTNLNNAIQGTELENMSIDEMMKQSTLPAPVRNNGGGHWNHSMFWSIMKPNGGGEPTGEVGEAIKKAFGSYEEFKTKFAQAATTRFGSGWAWLCKVEGGAVQICSTPNQDNPLMDVAEVKGTPILGVDVWEHAYYLKYQNRRADYLAAFWNVVNWDVAGKRYEDAL